VYHASEQLSIKGNIANGFSAPNYAQLTAFGRHEGTYRFEAGDNSLDMERNTEIDVSFQWQGDNAGILLSGYMNIIKDYIYINPTPDSVKQYRIYRWTQHDANINGLELNFVLHPEQAKWFDGSIRAGLIRGQLTNDAGDLPYIPANKVITEVSFKKEQYKGWKNLYATLEVAAYGPQNKTAQFESPTPGYAVTDVYFGALTPIGKRQRWHAVIFCTNLFNTDYVNHLSLIKSINVKDPGRNAGLKLRYQF
jgi:iron complex outermembrane receptor protein